MSQAFTLATAPAPAGDCLPCKIRRDQEQAATRAASTRRSPRRTFKIAAASTDPDAAADPTTAGWHGVIVQENVMTGDGRMIERGALRWADLPIPLRWAKEDNGEHLGSVVIGRITALNREANGDIAASGDLDLGSAEGREAARHIGKLLTNGVSVDLDEVSFQIRVAKELLEESPEPILMEPSPEAGDPEDEPDDPETDEEGRVTVVDVDSDSEVMVTDDARIRAATLVQIPAFADAKIVLDEPDKVLAIVDPDAVTDEDEDPDPKAPADEEDQPPSGADADPDEEDDQLAASAAPQRPPAEWFEDPQLDGPTPITITEDGRIYGHLAEWGTCHTAYSDRCVQPPHSSSGYGYFKTGSIMTDQGEIAVGRITMDTLHAKKTASAADTLSHYEHTGRAAADVVAGDDDHGIWVAGAIRPALSEDQVRSLRAAPLSGDWRRIGGTLELVAALAVNVAGFPIPRPQGLLASGHQTALIASGMIPPRQVRNPDLPGALSADDLRYLKRLADRERSHALRSDQAAQLAARVQASALALRVNHRPLATTYSGRK